MATPPATAPAQTRRMVAGSPAWKPQATFALVTTPRSASSSPSRQMPNPSPRPALEARRAAPEPPEPDPLAEVGVEVDGERAGAGHRRSLAPVTLSRHASGLAE